MDEAPAILAWAIAGTRSWLTRGRLDPPGRVATATETYRAEQDVLGSWIAERCLQSAAVTGNATSLIEDYRHYCETYGERRPSHRTFGPELERRGFTKERDTGNRVAYRGLALLTQRNQEVRIDDTL